MHPVLFDFLKIMHTAALQNLKKFSKRVIFSQWKVIFNHLDFLGIFRKLSIKIVKRKILQFFKLMK